MECTCIRCLMEIQITSKDLISTFTTQHHFYTHRLNDSCQKIHRSGCTYCSDIVSLYIINHIAYSVKTFLDSIVYFVMYCSDVFCHETGLFQIGRSLKPYSKRMKLRPPCILFSISFHTFVGKQFRYGRNNRRVKSAGK